MSFLASFGEILFFVAAVMFIFFALLSSMAQEEKIDIEDVNFYIMNIGFMILGIGLKLFY